MMEYIYLYLLSPLHTGSTTQEGNFVSMSTDKPVPISCRIREKEEITIS